MFRLRAHPVTNSWLWKRLLQPIFGRLHILSFGVRPTICLLRAASQAAVPPATVLLSRRQKPLSVFPPARCFQTGARGGARGLGLEVVGRRTRSLISPALPSRQALPRREQRGAPAGPKLKRGSQEQTPLTCHCTGTAWPLLRPAFGTLSKGPES